VDFSHDFDIAEETSIVRQIFFLNVCDVFFYLLKLIIEAETSIVVLVGKEVLAGFEALIDWRLWMAVEIFGLVTFLW